MNILIFLISILFMTFSGSIGALNFKKGIEILDLKNIKRIFFIKHFYVGGVFYMLGLLINMFLMKYIDYSILYPTTSLTYIWTIILSHFVLDENFTRFKLFSMLLIIGGIILINV